MRLREALLILTALCGVALPASAQGYPDGEMSTLRFRPAAGPGNFFLVQGAQVPTHLRYSVGLWVEGAGPLLRQQGADCVIDNATPCTPAKREERVNSIPFAAYGHVTASVALFERAQLALDLPIGGNGAETLLATYVDDDGDVRGLRAGPKAGFAIADPRVLAKVHLLGAPDDLFSMAADAHLTVPLARLTAADQFAGERTVQAGGSLIGELRHSMFRFAVNVGATYRPRSRYLTARTGTEVTYAAAAQLAPTPSFAITLEGNGGVTVVGKGKNPAELLLGLTLGQWNWRVHLGGGLGLTDAVGTPDGRGFLALVYMPSEHDRDGDGIPDWEDACRDVAEDADGHEDHDGCPDEDNDGDGLSDARDACPDEAEDRDGVQDEDGCPDPDNDGDGVLDGYDSCPHTPEDMDGDRDDDGCPEDDRDRDGVSDATDLCPNEPEDTDGLGDEDGCPEDDFDRDGIPDDLDSCPDEPELRDGVDDEDGCPEPDQDGDGISDARDRCPTKAETLNGHEDHTGCPDGPARLTLVEGRLVPTAPLLFSETGELSQPRTFTALDAAVAFVRRHHAEGSVAVTVQAPPRDAGADARGEAVRGYLITQGLDPARVFVERVPAEMPHVELTLVGPDVPPRRTAPLAAPAPTDEATAPEQ